MSGVPFTTRESYSSTIVASEDYVANMIEPSRTTTIVAPLPSTHLKRPTGNFLDTDSEMAAARKTYLKMAVSAVVMILLIIFGILPLYWGALWTAPKPLLGWIVDFDESSVGEFVTGALQNASVSTIAWQVIPPSHFPGGPAELGRSIKDEQAWIAISINPNATQILESAVASADVTYRGDSVITVYAVEARQETAFRNLLRPTVQTMLPRIAEKFALQFAKDLSSSTSSNLTNLINVAPQLVTTPISYTIQNLAPFDMPVATAVTMVGLIYLLILAFFLLNNMLQARMVSGLEKKLSLGGLLRLRIGTALISYFIVSLFFTLLSRAFQLSYTRHFGHAGFILIWIANFLGMLALGLTLEAMVTLLTVRFVGFFMISWVVVNIASIILPIQGQYVLYRYGYAMPFYHVSRAVRTVVFGTKNELGLNFGVLLSWSILSICTMSLFQYWARRREEQAAFAAAESVKVTEKEIV